MRREEKGGHSDPQTLRPSHLAICFCGGGHGFFFRTPVLDVEFFKVVGMRNFSDSQSLPLRTQPFSKVVEFLKVAGMRNFFLRTHDLPPLVACLFQGGCGGSDGGEVWRKGQGAPPLPDPGKLSVGELPGRESSSEKG